MIVVPPQTLDPRTLQALIEEFVTRQGAVHGHGEPSLDSQVAAVARQLAAGTAQIIFDESDDSWTILPVPRSPVAHSPAERSPINANRPAGQEPGE